MLQPADVGEQELNNRKTKRVDFQLYSQGLRVLYGEYSHLVYDLDEGLFVQQEMSFMLLQDLMGVKLGPYGGFLILI